MPSVERDIDRQTDRQPDRQPVLDAKLVLSEYKSMLAIATKSVRSLGVRFAAKVLVNDPATEVIRDVIGQRRDLVIMTAEGKGGLKVRLFDSTSH